MSGQKTAAQQLLSCERSCCCCLCRSVNCLLLGPAEIARAQCSSHEASCRSFEAANCSAKCSLWLSKCESSKPEDFTVLLCRIPDFFHEQVPVPDPPSLKRGQAAVESLGNTGLCYGLAPHAGELVLPFWLNTTGPVAATVGIPCQRGDALL